MNKKRIFSGIQPSGIPTLGNYFGALRNWVDMQDEYDCIYSIVDMHAITVRQDPEVLRKRTYSLYALLLSCGIAPSKSTLFIQSHVPQHAELAWILNCYTMFGELSRMTQFKDKSAKHSDNINAGLFTYPVLMAADILLYNAACVPVGEDQKQHVELARNVAVRFNSVFPDAFIVPEPFIPKLGGKVMSLADPTKKMDKSDPNPSAYISMDDDKDNIIKKFKKAVTDSEPVIRYDPENKPGVSNLMSIYALCTGKTLEDIEREFDGKGYGYFKPTVGEAVDSVLAPIRTRTRELLEHSSQLDKLIADGAARAAEEAEAIMRPIRKLVGFCGKGR